MKKLLCYQGLNPSYSALIRMQNPDSFTEIIKKAKELELGSQQIAMNQFNYSPFGVLPMIQPQVTAQPFQPLTIQKPQVQGMHNKSNNKSK
jgi:hypothetical protein